VHQFGPKKGVTGSLQQRTQAALRIACVVWRNWSIDCSSEKSSEFLAFACRRQTYPQDRIRMPRKLAETESIPAWFMHYESSTYVHDTWRNDGDRRSHLAENSVKKN
jgi:hypothetical protein